MRVGLGISKSGCCIKVFLGAGSTPGGRVKGWSGSGSPGTIGVLRHS